MTTTSHPGASGRAPTEMGEARVEYRLVRNGIVRDVRRGRLEKVDVCDAHPELLRAARNVGVPTGEECPICEEAGTVEVTFVFGAGLPPGGRCPGNRRELDRLRRRADPVTCYTVEVCPDCAFHHLVRRYPAGGRTPATKRAGGRG